jgi:hypothetical protein
MIIGNITTIAKIEAGFILVDLLAAGNTAGRIAGMLSDRSGCSGRCSSSSCFRRA